MKSCPGCNFLVADDADDCRHCGVTIDGSAPAAHEPTGPVGPARRETVSTRLTAGVIVVASLSVLGVGAWAFHHSPPAPAPHQSPATPAADKAVTYRTETVVSSGITFHLDVAVGNTEPDLSNGVVSKYGSAREFDLVHIPGGSGTDLTAMLSTFSAGWPTTHLQSSATADGPALAFDLTDDTRLTHGVLIDAGANGVFLLAIKAPLGSTINAVDRAVLARAQSSLTIGS